MRYVLDCSVAVKWFVPEEDSDRALALLANYQDQTVDFVSVETIHSEFGHALRSPYAETACDDLERRLELFLTYYLLIRPHLGLCGATPAEVFLGLDPAPYAPNHRLAVALATAQPPRPSS